VNIVVGVETSVLLDVGLYVCQELSVRENHRTNNAYERAVFAKYLPLGLMVVLWPVAYVAILKPLTGITCFGAASDQPSCLSELANCVPVFVTSFMITEHFRDVLVPWLFPQVTYNQHSHGLQMRMKYITPSKTHFVCRVGH
jgi:hypothetical protein